MDVKTALNPLASVLADVVAKGHPPAGRDGDAAHAGLISDLLAAIRHHLDMEVAFVSEFSGGRRHFRFVDSTLDDCPVVAGASDPLEETYCQRVVDGRLPSLLRDAREHPEARTLPVTLTMPIGAHLSVPVRLGNGQLYGTFCCFSSRPDPELDQRDLALVRALAEFTGMQIGRRIELEMEHDEAVGRIRTVITSRQFHPVYQPIFQLGERRLVGVESLTRFTGEPHRGPDAWFREAADVGMAEDLEIEAIRAALAGVSHLPRDVYLSLNTSPANIISGAFARSLDGFPLGRLVAEITEHDIIRDYAALKVALDPLRRRGLRLAVDDAGAGYSSFRHILHLAPDVIKLDITLTRDIDTDPSRRALATALVQFAAETNSTVVAEGVETEAELATLRGLRVSNAQGYLLSKPLAMRDLAHALGWITH